MSNSDSHQKQPPKKPTNSYSLLLKGLSEVEKTNPKSSNSVKSRTTSRTVSPMNQASRNDDRQENPPGSRASRNDDRQENPPGSRASNNDAQCEDPDIPDRSFGDYYCKLCDSHMNSDNMWEAHVTGKRHIKNVKKGDPDPKYDLLPNEVSPVNKEMKNVTDPVVGLSYIHEIRRKEDNVPPTNYCYLCQSSLATIPLLIEHVLSMKHRLNYIKERSPEKYELINATNLKKGHMEPLVLEAARELEEEHGRGVVEVKKEKKKGPVYTYSGKRSFNLDDDDDDGDGFNGDRYQKSYKSSKVESSSSVWKTVDTGKNYGRRGRSRSPKDFEDTFTNRARSRSPRGFKDRKQNVHSDEEHSMDGYRKSYSKRERSSRQDEYERHRSFSKSDKSPREDDYHFRSSDDYLHSSRIEKNKQSYDTPRYDEPSTSRGYDMPSTSRGYDIPSTSRGYDMPSTSRGYDMPSTSRETLKMPFNCNSPDRPSYSAPRYNESSRELLKQSFKSHQKPVTVPQENYLVAYQRPAESPNRPKSVEDVLQDILLFSSEDCYRLFYERMKLLPEITQITEMLLLVRLIGEAQKKMKSKLSEQVISALTEKYLRSEANAANISIPGLGDVMPSTVSHNIRLDKSSNAVGLDKSSNAVDAENFINNILKSANVFPTSKAPNSQLTNMYKSPSVSLTQSSSYQTPPSISSQQAAALLGSFQVPPVNPHQAPPASSYQSSSNSYQTPSSNSYQPSSNSYQPSSNSYQAPSANPYDVPLPNSYRNMPFASGSASNYLPNTNISNPAPTQKSDSQMQIYSYTHLSAASSAPKHYPHTY